MLPADCRLLCAAVCRGWRAVLSDRSLWTRLNLSAASDITRAVTDALLRAAAARAGGQLQILDVTGCREINLDSLCAVLAANAGALRELHAVGATTSQATLGLASTEVEPLLRAAPLLLALHTKLYANESAGVRRMLHNEPPFGPLRATHLDVGGAMAADDVVAVAGDLPAHASLKSVRFIAVSLASAAALDAVVDAALACRLTHLCVCGDCGLSPASVPALARLLGGDALTSLDISGLDTDVDFLDAQAATLMGAALRANRTLATLRFACVQFWRRPAAAAALLVALTAHTSLQTLVLCSNGTNGLAGHEAAYDALGALMAANAPALQELDLRGCDLGDAALAPLVDALASNTHLLKLLCGSNRLSADFARDRLLPAVRANASLRKLGAGGGAAAEAEAVVAARAQ
jgi:hypothetical protein